MCYIIQQVEGKLYDQAKEYTRIRLAEGIPSAIQYFESVAGKTGIPESSVWWIYNAESALRRKYEIDWRKYDHCRTEESRAKAICYDLTKKYGGKWEYYYEY